ncbi:MAG: hypothetical protein A2X36_09895 [Elusimicrobia bacterium GWA2_69_24]|nr:MAG: hypothetical protein A2X36_09895 [Elusimicrobia bacterium GWA2_69_24]HBL17588.1 antitoxin [Elusimicrobiota bacterium]
MGHGNCVAQRLSKEERALSSAYKRGLWRRVKDLKKEVRRYRSFVKAALQKRCRVNIRMSPQDLEGIQQRALEEGMPYQTLIASVLHKFVTGSL